MNASSDRNGSNHGRAAFVLLSLMVLLPIAAGTLSRAVAQAGSDGEDSLYKHLSVFTEVLSLIQRSYVDETSMESLFAGAFEGATNALDSFSTYVPGASVGAYREALARGNENSGVTVGRDDGISFVIGVEEGSPGALAGLMAGDVLAKINDRSTREMPLWELHMLFAQESDRLSVEVLRRGEIQKIDLTLEPFERGVPTTRVESDIPVLRITSFGDETSPAVLKLLDSGELANSNRLIIDVRGVSGGSVREAYDVAALFRSGQLGELRSRGEVAEVFSSEDEPQWKGRLAILADGACQGASEVFLAALRDRQDVDVVGRRTFGHAGRQALQALASGATLFFTDAFYTGPNGEILNRGIEPEVGIETRLLSLGAEQDREKDETLDRAIEILLREPAGAEAA